jgi:hypothetical protein
MVRLSIILFFFSFFAFFSKLKSCLSIYFPITCYKKGLVDIWGPRIDWTAFAPDFQALPSNVEYVEQEDEFDVVIDGDGSVVHSDSTKEHEDEGEEALDVVTVERIPAFESDSEDDVFYFLTTVNCLLNKREKRNESQML